MDLDVRGWAVARGAAFNDVRVERTLGEEMSVFNSLGLVLEDVDKYMADDAPLFLRIGNRLERFQETFAGVDHVQVGAEVILEGAAHRFRLAHAEQSIVHKDARHLRSDCPQKYGSRHR